MTYGVLYPFIVCVLSREGSRSASSVARPAVARAGLGGVWEQAKVTFAVVCVCVCVCVCGKGRWSWGAGSPPWVIPFSQSSREHPAAPSPSAVEESDSDSGAKDTPLVI